MSSGFCNTRDEAGLVSGTDEAKSFAEKIDDYQEIADRMNGQRKGQTSGKDMQLQN